MAVDAAPTYVCRCEEITVDEVRRAIADGARSVNDVKRRTRAGMGACQGIFCVRPIADLVHAETGLPHAAIVPMTARPPVRLITLGQLAAMEE
jgi:bacterioferritin-associated ferredoxin